jgi:RND family efflux transporter MFP subunit
MTRGTTDDTSAVPVAFARQNSLLAVPVPQDNPPPRRSGRGPLVVAALVAIALAGTWWVLNGSGAPPGVAVETLAAGPVERVLAVSGRTETDALSNVVSSVAARVDAVMVREGDAVGAGDVLLLLDSEQQTSRIRQALAALDAAILREQSAQSDLDRATRLGAAVSAVALADAERAVALAKTEVDRLQAAFEQAQLTLRDYRISAPIGGRVLSRSVEPGDLVGTTTVLMRIANTDSLHVEAQIDETFADRIRVGQPVWLQLTGRSEIHRGRVSYVAAEVDELTGSLRVKLSFDTVPDAQIGLTTGANILIDRVETALTVPRSALVAGGSDAAVMVVRDGRAKLTKIDYVDWPADRVEVTSGLGEGDQVVLSPGGIEAGQPLVAQDASATGD